MKITVNDQQSVAMIREQFSRFFPFLKLEFFSKPHQPGRTTRLKFRQPPDKRIGEIRTCKACGSIDVDPEMSAGELEQVFCLGYGLHVQVLRKFGAGWIETSATDSWSLEKQNARGEQDLRNGFDPFTTHLLYNV